MDQHYDSAATSDNEAISSVAFNVAPDDSDPRTPRVVFEAEVIRTIDFTGEPELSVRFVSNVAFGGEAPVAVRPGFQSGVQFNE